MRLCLVSSIVPILWLAAVTLAEPPVGDGYPSARSSPDDHHNDHHHNDEHDPADHRSLSPEHGPPASPSTRSAPEGYEYNAPSARTSNTRRFPPATVRVSFNQRFKAAGRSSARASQPASRSSARASQPASRSSARASQPASRSSQQHSLDQQYGAPAVSARTLSTQYGMPDARSTPSREYGAPVVSARHNSQSNFDDASRPSDFPASNPSSRSQVSSGYDAPKSNFGARNAPSEKYGVPSTRSQTTHDASRRSDTEDVDSVSPIYGAPNQKVSETYGTPNARSLSQEYGTPASHSNLMNDDGSSASASSRSSPSESYLPAARSAAPSEQYGAPEQRDGSGGYDYSHTRARALEEELQNQKDASYDFGYEISEEQSGSDFGHSESREADKTRGSYFLVRPDGVKQTVDYEADEGGFRPRISVEEPHSGGYDQHSGGYDQNAQELARAAGGPY